MAVFTITELSPLLSHFDNTSVAGDTVVNSTSAMLKLCLGTVTTNGDVSIVTPNVATIVTVKPGETSAALVDGDYYFYDNDANLTTVPGTITTKA